MTPTRNDHFASKRRKVLVISDSPRNPRGEEIEVSSKIAARKVAAEHGAQCWNF